MPPQTLSLIIWGIQQLIQHEPEIAADIKALMTKADPTDADWQTLHAKVLAKGYFDYVPASALPQTVPIKVLPPPGDQPAAAQQPTTLSAASGRVIEQNLGPAK
jgi:hypothetical protein